MKTEQDKCPYCHEPFESFVTRNIDREDKYEAGDGIRMKLNNSSEIQIDAMFDTGYIGDHLNIPISFCPFCGRDLRKAEK